MKKFVLVFVLVLGFILCFAANTQTGKNTSQQEKFVNPAFYEKMISDSNVNYEQQLTPTGIYHVSSNGFKYNYTCKLIYNQMDSVILKCFEYNEETQKEETRIFIYILKPCTEENLCLDKGGWLVYKDIVPERDFFDRASYIIPSKSDNAPKDKFVNPLFYKELSPTYPQRSPIFLTPTSRTHFDSDNKKVVEKCEMLENTPMFVTFICSFYYNKGKKTRSNVIRYVLKGCDETKTSKTYCSDVKWWVQEQRVGVSDETFIIKKDMGQ